MTEPNSISRILFILFVYAISLPFQNFQFQLIFF